MKPSRGKRWESGRRPGHFSGPPSPRRGTPEKLPPCPRVGWGLGSRGASGGWFRCLPGRPSRPAGGRPWPSRGVWAPCATPSGVVLGGLQTLEVGAGAAPAALGGLTCARTQVRARSRPGVGWVRRVLSRSAGPDPPSDLDRALRRGARPVGRRSQPKFSPTRLETRTKESNSCASRRGLRSPKAERKRRPLLEGG